MSYFQVFISAENAEQVNIILNALLARKLILGGPILQGPAKFWWKGEIVKMGYSYLLSYTIEKNKEAIIAEVKKVSIEEVPMISFIPIEANIELLKLIDDTLS